jgi:hypothetical protein
MPNWRLDLGDLAGTAVIRGLGPGLGFAAEVGACGLGLGIGRWRRGGRRPPVQLACLAELGRRAKERTVVVRWAGLCLQREIGPM